MFRNGLSQVCTKMPYHRETFRWAYINVFLSKIQSWLKESGKTSSKQSHCGLGSKVKGCGQNSCKGKHRKTFVAGWDISLLTCAEYLVKHSGQLRKTRGVGGLHKWAGKVTPGRKAKLSVSSQLPFNTVAKSAPAPSECGVGFNVYTMADRMYPCDPANILITNKTALHFMR